MTPPSFLKAALLSGLLLLVPGTAIPQEEEPAPAPGPADGETPPAVETTIQDGDVLDISVFNHQELSRVVPVQTDGSVMLPFIGRLGARGRGVDALAGEIAGALERDYKLRDPRVSVSITSSGTRAVYVLGRVRTAGSHTLPTSRPLSLLQLISLAGGFEEDADRTRIRVQRTARDGEKAVLTVDLSGVELEGNMEEDIPLEEGDTVFVPRVEEVSVLGQVGRPGTFVIRAGETLTLLRAVARAEGFTRLAKQSSVIWIRRGRGEAKPVTVDGEDVLEGKIPDPVLSPGDVVYVPERAW